MTQLMLENEPLVRAQHPLVSLLMRPWRLPWALVELLIMWVTTRRWMIVLACLPLLAVGGLLGLAAALGNMMTTHEQALRYIHMVDSGRSKDKATDELCLRKLINMQLEPGLGFRVARVLAARGHMDAARVQMQKLAPTNERGFVPAHKWLAMDILDRLRESGGNEIPSVLFHHAKIAANFLRDDADAARVYAMLLLRAGRVEESLEYLERATVQKPELFLLLAALQTQLGQLEQAKQTSSQAAEYFRTRIKRDPKDVSSRVNLVAALLPLGQLQEADAVVRDGLSLRDDAQLRSAYADCRVWQFDKLTPEKQRGIEGFSRLQSALSVAPMHAPTLARVAAMVVVSPDSEWIQIKDRLEESLVSGTAPATCHLLLADGYLRRGENDKAKIHLDLAHQIDAGIIIVLNNLSWVLAFREPTDVSRAEKLIDQAMALVASSNNSQHLELRETRGQIKLRLKKYDAAIPDLESVLEHYADRDVARLALAEAYEGEGQSERAAEHRRQVQENAARRESDKAMVEPR